MSGGIDRLLESAPSVGGLANPDFIENNDGFRIYRPTTTTTATARIVPNDP
jgi:hypothetical protein